MRILLAFVACLFHTPQARAEPGSPAADCAGVKVQSDDFGGGRFWAYAETWYGSTIEYFRVTQTTDSVLLKAYVNAGGASLVAVPPGASAEIALMDGRVFQWELKDEIAPMVVSATGTLWAFTVPLSPEQVAAFSSSAIKNVRIKSDAVVLGGIKGPPAKLANRVRKAVACLATPPL